MGHFARARLAASGTPDETASRWQSALDSMKRGGAYWPVSGKWPHAR